MSPTAVRVTYPFELMSTSSSAFVTRFAATTAPFRADFPMAIIPFPPRFCERYAETAVRLPYPFSVTISRVSLPFLFPFGALFSSASDDSLLTMTICATKSSSLRPIPRMPRVLRPRGLTSFSLKRMATPLWVTRITSELPFVTCAPISLSPSSRLTAIIPLDSVFSNLESPVFLTIPRCVAMKTNSSDVTSATSPASAASAPSTSSTS